MKHTILPNDNFIATVRPVIEDTLGECERLLPSHKGMRIILNYTEDPFVSEHMGGSSGRVGGDTTMEIEVNTNVETWKEGARSSVAHEYNHIVWHQIHGKDWRTVTLGELIAMEGFAQNFEERLVGEPPVYATYVNEETLGTVWGKVRDHLEENGAEWWQRLSFEDSDEFPLWSGYTLAYVIIQKQMEKQRDVKWPELMQITAEELLEF